MTHNTRGPAAPHQKEQIKQMKYVYVVKMYIGECDSETCLRVFSDYALADAWREEHKKLGLITINRVLLD